MSEDDRILLESLAPRVSSLLKQYRGHEVHTRRFVSVQDALRAAISLRQHDHNGLTTVCHDICLATARRLKLPSEEVEHLAFALRCYDVGLTKISGQLLRKSSPLAPEEREKIQGHVAASLELLVPLQIPSKVRQIILHHHERFDGDGYPDGLEGEAIPIGARLVTLADSLHAMLQERPYRPARGLDEALTEIEELAGHQFCPRLAAPFLLEARSHGETLRHLQRELYSGGAVAVPVVDPVVITAGSVQTELVSIPVDSAPLSVSDVPFSRDTDDSR
jgi:HD-GYP domain-containing protein (c-di-GMP phosphodiesterase class II)